MPSENLGHYDWVSMLHLMKTSLRSKRFQSSYCAKVRAEAIKKGHSFFCSLPNFLDELARKRLLRRLHEDSFYLCHL